MLFSCERKSAKIVTRNHWRTLPATMSSGLWPANKSQGRRVKHTHEIDTEVPGHVDVRTDSKHPWLSQNALGYTWYKDTFSLGSYPTGGFCMSSIREAANWRSMGWSWPASIFCLALTVFFKFIANFYKLGISHFKKKNLNFPCFLKNQIWKVQTYFPAWQTLAVAK